MSRVEFGLSMLYSLNKPFKKMVNHLESIDAKIVEIVDDGLHALNKRRISILNEIRKSYELRFTVHSPFADINIASPSKSLLKVMLKRLNRSMFFANALDAELWVFHPGNKTGISMFYPGEDWKQNVKTISLLHETAKDFGLKIAVENLPEKYGFIMKNPEDFIRLYNETSVDDVGIVLDTGHSNLEGETEAFLRKLSKRIVHMHISDNMGEHDQHLGVGCGNIDWKKFAKILHEIKYEKTIIIETVENVQKSLHKIQELLSFQ
jgi:sugar phosphate isomerase/epimerase